MRDAHQPTPIEQLTSFMGHVPIHTVSPSPSPVIPPNPLAQSPRSPEIVVADSPPAADDFYIQSATPTWRIGTGVQPAWKLAPTVKPEPGTVPPHRPYPSREQDPSAGPGDVLEQEWVQDLQVFIDVEKRKRAQPVYGFLSTVAVKAGATMEDLIEKDLPSYRGMDIREFFKSLAASGEDAVTLLRAWLTSTRPATTQKTHGTAVVAAGESEALFQSPYNEAGEPLRTAQAYVQREIEMMNLQSASMYARQWGQEGFQEIVMAPQVVGAIHIVMADLKLDGDAATSIIQGDNVKTALLGTAVGLQIQMSGTKVARRQYINGSSRTTTMIESMPRHRRQTLEAEYARALRALQRTMPSSAAPSRAHNYGGTGLSRATWGR